eukprot:s1919_g2.t1
MDMDNDEAATGSRQSDEDFRPQSAFEEPEAKAILVAWGHSDLQWEIPKPPWVAILNFRSPQLKKLSDG